MATLSVALLHSTCKDVFCVWWKFIVVTLLLCTMALSPLVIVGVGLSFMWSIKQHKVYAQSTCDQQDCVRCDLETTQCMKCLNVMDEESRKCLQSCPVGLDPAWSRLASVHGKVCSGRSVLSLVSHKEVSIIAGASVGGAVCVGIFLGLLLLKKKSSKNPPDSPIVKILPRMAQDRRPKTEETSVKGKEREEFLSKLRPLRSEAPYILRMMAETRTKFRGFTGPDAPSDTKAKACRAVVRDLSRVLSLVSQKEENLRSAPKDWQRLLSWTERLLIRYKRQQTIKSCDGKFLSNGTERSGLFVTRQEKALQQRRLRNNNNYSSTDNLEDHEISKSIMDPIDRDGFLTPIYLSEVEEDVKQMTPITVQSSEESMKKKKKDTMKLNLNLLNKLLSPKEPESPIDDLERGDHLDVDQRSDYIQSQTFFDHIEAFAFDMDDQFAQDSPKSPTKMDRNDSNNNEKGSKSSSNFSLNAEELQFIKKPKKRPGKIKRMSSSLLLKGRWENYRNKSSVKNAKQRKPLTRQRQVEKNKKQIIYNKYLRNKESFSSNESQDSSNHNSTDIRQYDPPLVINGPCEKPYDQVVDSTYIEQALSESKSLNEVIQGDDMYVKVVRKPVYHHPVVTENIKMASPGRLTEHNYARFDVVMAV